MSDKFRRYKGEQLRKGLKSIVAASEIVDHVAIYSDNDPLDADQKKAYDELEALPEFMRRQEAEEKICAILLDAELLPFDPDNDLSKFGEVFVS